MALTQENYTNLYKLLGISLLLILGSGYVSYSLYMKNNPKSNFNEWLNGKKFSMKSVMVGMASGVVFGFIDNAGLFFGMDALNPFLKELGITGENEKAGWGNTYSDFLGSSMGTFIGSIIISKTKIEESPIWADMLGIIVGCILGIYIPKALVGDK
jgi:hypothetical protein